MSDLAVRDLQAHRVSVLTTVRAWLIDIFGRESDHALPPQVRRQPDHAFRSTARPTTDRPQPRPVATASAHTEREHRWERHPQLRSRLVANAPVTGDRAARLEAERGLLLARGGKLVEAIDAFSTAARDHEIDLAALPGFWDLPRNGMLTAVQAYERAGRLREAAALEARIRHLLKPRAIRTTPTVRPARLSASGD